MGEVVVTLIALALTGAAAWGGYHLWPAGILDIPLSDLTLGVIAKAIGAIILLLVALALGISTFATSAKR